MYGEVGVSEQEIFNNAADIRARGNYLISPCAFLTIKVELMSRI